MKLEYFELLSFEPTHFQSVGSVISPRLKDIAKKTYQVYNSYLSILLMTPKMYFEILQQSEYYDAIPEDEKNRLNIYDLIIQDKRIRVNAEKALDFFMMEKVVFDQDHLVFFTYDGTEDEDGNPVPTGVIHREIYGQICDVILQRNYIRQKTEDISNVKNKRAFEIAKKLQKGRNKKHRTVDKNMELANIISAVSNKHDTLNIVNIWDLTVYQLWDTFQRLCNNHVLNIQSMSVAAWGDKDNHFDAAAWFKKLENRMEGYL